MMRRRRGTRRTAAQWQDLVERSEREGQTRGRFCAAHGLALSTFALWRRKLRGARGAGGERGSARGAVRGVVGSAGDGDGRGVVGGRARARCGRGTASAKGAVMLSTVSTGRIWLCTQPTDMRCSFDGLSARVRRYLGEDPTSGCWFVFVNRRQTKIKISWLFGRICG